MMLARRVVRTESAHGDLLAGLSEFVMVQSSVLRCYCFKELSAYACWWKFSGQDMGGYTKPYFSLLIG